MLGKEKLAAIGAPLEEQIEYLGAAFKVDPKGAAAAMLAEAEKMLSLRHTIALIVSAKFARAQKLMLLGWVDADLIKAAELVGLSTLELA